MKKAKVAGNPAEDMTLPDASVEIHGQTYHLCFDYAALSSAKRDLRSQGVEINILAALVRQDVDIDTIPALFFAAARKAHPELKYQQVVDMCTLSTSVIMGGAILNAYAESLKIAQEHDANPPTVKQS